MNNQVIINAKVLPHGPVRSAWLWKLGAVVWKPFNYDLIKLLILRIMCRMVADILHLQIVMLVRCSSTNFSYGRYRFVLCIILSKIIFIAGV